MWSSTVMPAQRILGAPAGPPASADDIPAAFDKGADDVMRDRDRGRGRQALRMLAHQHLRGFGTIEPARVLELRSIDDDLGRTRFRMAADHQRHRERPRLRPEITDAAADHPGFLENLPARRLLDRFPGLDEAGETRPG